MARTDDDDPFGLRPRPNPPVHTVGEPLDTMAVAELAERIALLQAEIVRLEAARAAKTAAGTAADAFFRPPGERA